MSSSGDASIVLLTYNGARYLPQVLEMIGRQKPAQIREIIVIDSGSTDGTLEILRDAPVELHQIAQREFSHSKTRNLGARLSKGKFIVFLTQDATPADSCWLERLLHPFGELPGVAGVFSRQIPRPGSDLLEANDLRMYFPNRRQVKSFPGDSKSFREKIWNYIQFSNASGAYDRDLLLQNPFDESLSMAEDQEWAKRMLEKGYTIVYEPESIVLHSHELSCKGKYDRNYQMGASFSRFLSPLLGRRWFPIGPILYNLAADLVYLAKSDSPIAVKVKWLSLSPFHRAAMHYAYYKGWNSV